MLKKMKKESQLFTTELPKGTLMYAFGSSICSKEFNDIDLLFVIPDSVDKLFSYDCVQKFCRKLEANIGTVVDFTILTDLEEQKIRFVEQVKAILLLIDS